MCGIAGFFGKKIISESAIRSTLSLMERRGPDHQGYFQESWGDNSVTLLHSRLAIIDLDVRSNQPFSAPGSIISFNGEIYNYREIRSELEETGVSFETESDTEVLLRWYQYKQEGFEDLLEGMWSFGIYDQRVRSLTLSRDRFGEKPLYLYRRSEGLYFGSEPKFIRALSGDRIAINTGKVLHFLVYGHRSIAKDSTSYHSGIESLPAGTSLRINDSLQEHSTRYWNPRVEIDTSITSEQAVSGIRERFLRSMEIRTRADVPLAFCLSGGVDSGAIVSVAAKQLNCIVESFSIIDSHQNFNELENITATVRDIGSRHHMIELEPQDFIARLRELVSYHEAPLSTISYYVHAYLSQKIQESGFRVVFAGTGADELLTGYYDHFLFHLEELRGTDEFQQAYRDWQREILPSVRNPLLTDLGKFASLNTPGEHVYSDAALCNSFMRRPLTGDFYQENYSAHVLRNRMANELFHEIVPVILFEDDLNSMYYSLENRSPFLDRQLYEYCARIPTKHLIQHGYSKYLLRSALEGILNDQVRLDRKKVGFNADLDSVLSRHSIPFQQQILAEHPIYEYVEHRAIEQLLSKQSLSMAEQMFLFRFLGCWAFLENA